MDDANYADWTWEMVLGTVLNIGVPDRSAVTGQPWLVIKHGNDTLPGAREVWSASWTAAPTKAADAISVYLNPALNDPAGPASLFQDLPGVLGGLFDGADGFLRYSLLPIQPPAFLRAGLALAGLTDWFGAAAQQFNGMNQSTQDNLSGAAAQLLADLFSRLGSVAASLHNQMSGQVSYASAISDTAGGAALRFLNSLWLAYTSWTRQPAYTPAGAVVQVLQAVGQPQPDNTYRIDDPEHTAYGDLTTDQGWATVEQRSKNQWLSLLTTGTDGFSGLDPLAHAALSALISAYDSVISVLQPVVVTATAAGPPPPGPPPVGGPDHPAGLGPAPAAPPLGTPPLGTPPPGPLPPGGSAGPVGLEPAPSSGALSSSPPGGGPGNPPLVFGSYLAMPNANAFGSPPSLPSGGGSGSGPPGSPAIASLTASALVIGAAEGPDAAAADAPDAGSLVPAGGSASAGFDDPPRAGGPAVLSGAIGAVADDTSGALGDEAPPQGTPGASVLDGVLFAGAIGRPSEPSNERAQPGGAVPGPGEDAAAARVAPVAGATLGRGVGGAVLIQAKVPALAAKPPPVRSSPINAGLVPALPGASAGTPDASSNATGHDLVTTLMLDQGGEGYAGSNGPMMLPPGALGAGLGGGPGGPPAERQRLSYQPEDTESWGADLGEPDTVMCAPRTMRQFWPDPAEQAEEVELPDGVGALGRRKRPT